MKTEKIPKPQFYGMNTTWLHSNILSFEIEIIQELDCIENCDALQFITIKISLLYKFCVGKQHLGMHAWSDH